MRLRGSLTWRRLSSALTLGWGVALLVLATPASASDGTVLVARVSGTITPVVAGYVVEGVERAERDRHAAYLLELNTPGGLDTSMRQIVQSFLDAQVPVIVHVSPAGGRAASAGSIVTSSAHIAAMSPGTTIGAATPVDGQTGQTASPKVVNDAAAYAQAVAAERGRDTQFAVESVRDGRSVTADEAIQIGAVDLVAAGVADVLSAVDGRDVELADGSSVVLQTANTGMVEYQLGFVRSVLQVLADPNLAFLLLSIGTLAVIYELATPGMGLGGVLGAIMLVLGFFALSVLPVNIAGLLLLALAAGLFVGEVFAPGIGVFAGGGVIALVFAGLFLFQEGQARVDPVLLLPTAVLIGIAVLIAGRLAWRARSRQPVSGAEAFTGREVVLRDASGGSGRTWFEGAWWSVRSEQELSAGQRVRLIGADGLTLIVEPIEPERNGI